MTATTRTRLGILTAAIALPVVLACGTGNTSSSNDGDQQPGSSEPAQVEQQQLPEEPAAEVPEVEIPDEPAEEAVYYENCTAVRDAGKAPIRKGDPGYSSKLDRDGDGVACET